MTQILNCAAWNHSAKVSKQNVYAYFFEIDEFVTQMLRQPNDTITSI